MRLILWQIERPYHEHRHLRARDQVIRAVVAAATTGGDVLRNQLLDPIRRPVIGGDVCKDTRSRRRGVGSAVLCALQKDRLIFLTQQKSRQQALAGFLLFSFLPHIEIQLCYFE